MNQEKFGQFIKEIRKKHNLTQKELADKYHVTYQAVSKWENGKNMPDTSLIKQISQDFNVSLEELFDGEYKDNKIKKQKKYLLLIIPIAILIILIIILLSISRDNNFEFKTLTSTCDNFNISGSIAYNKNKSAIYVANIEYCGGNDTEKYKEIECTLYESHNNIEKKISSIKNNKKENVTLEEFLQDVTFSVDDYEKSCKNYTEDTLYLLINAKDRNDKITTYKIPLKLEDSCSN